LPGVRRKTLMQKPMMVSLKNSVEEGNGKPPYLFSQEMAIKQNEAVKIL